MASKASIIRKLQAYKKNPDLIKEVSNTELADLVLVVMRAVETIDQSIQKGRLDGKTPQPDKDYLSLKTAQKLLGAEVRKMLTQADAVLSETSTELEKRVQKALQNIRDGKDGIVSDEEIQRAATIAHSLIELPDIDAIVTEQITSNPDAIRDALELLSGGDRYKVYIEDVEGLTTKLNELAQRSVVRGGTIGRNQVYGFIREAIADGTITATGGSTISVDGAEVTDPDFVSTGDVDFVASGADVTGDVIGLRGTPLDSTVGSPADGKILVFRSAGSDWVLEDKPAGGSNPAINDITDISITSVAENEVLAYDSGSSTWINQTPAEAGLAAASHTHTASDITDFDAEVANNSAVTANTAKVTNATHTGDVTGATALTIANDVVTNAKLANVATSTIKGRVTAATGDPEDLTATQVRTLLNVEDGADVTDTTNVTAAGALMDSEVTNLAQVKAFNSADYATAAQGATADTALQPGDNATELNGTAWRVLYTNGTGDVAELALGSDGQVLTSTGATTAPAFETPSGGGNTYFNNTYIDQSGGTSDTYGVLAGTINGANTTFTVSQSVYASGTLEVYLNGKLVLQGTGAGWVETTPASGTFDFVVAPETGDEITVRYQTEVLSSDTVLVSGGALGTPSSGVATNLTGTASGLTAGTVTTNANLTGVVTSTGNATAVADAALSIAKTSGLQTALDGKLASTTPFVKGISIEDPTATEDITLFFTDDAITITQMNAVLLGSATPSVTWTVRHNSDRSAAGAEVVTSGTTTTSTTTGSEVTSFNDATIPAGSWVWLETSSASGTVDEINVTIEYTRD